MFYTRPQNLNFSSMYKEPAENQTAGFMDVFKASQANVDTGNEPLSAYWNLASTYDDHNAKVKALTGVELSNPAKRYKGSFADHDEWKRYNEALTQYKADGGSASRGAFYERWGEQEYRRKLEELAVKFPDKRADLIPESGFGQQAMAKVVAGERALQKSKEGYGNGAWVPELLGAIWSAHDDPVTWLTAPVGFGGAGTGIKGIALAALKNGTANAAVEASIQPWVQDYRSQAGASSGVADAAYAVGGAFVFGAGLDAGVRSVARGLRSSFGYEPVVKDGVIVSYRKADAAGAVSEIPAEVVSKADAGDAAAIRQVSEVSGLAQREPVVRAALDAMDANETMLRKPIESVEDITHQGAVVQSLRHASDPDLEPLPVVHDGAGVPELKRLQDDILDARRDLGQVARALSVPQPDEARALLVQAAQTINARVAAMSADFEDKTRVLMSEDLIEAVSTGKVSREVADAVAGYVPDKGRHLRMANDLMERRPGSPEQARHMIHELATSPDYVDRIPDVAPAPGLKTRALDDPFGAEAKAQVDYLERQMGEELGIAPPEAKTKEDGGGKDFLDAVMEPGAPEPVTPAAALAQAIADVFDLAKRVLPEGTQVKVADDLGFDPVTGLPIDAVTTTGLVQLSAKALDPSARLGHEAVHVLVRSGQLTPAEVKVLAKAATKAGTFDEAAYRKAYESRDGLDMLIEEEAAAHVVEANVKVEPKAQRIIDKVKTFIERMRNAFSGLGFRSSDDVVQAVMSGDVAGRKVANEVMRNAGTSTAVVAPSPVSAPIDDFASSVSTLKDRLGIKTKQRDFGQDKMFALRNDGTELTLVDEVKALRSGSRIAIVQRHVAALGADADEIAASLERALRIDIKAATVPDLQRYIVALEDLAQVVENRVQHGYSVVDDVEAVRSLVTEKLDDLESVFGSIRDEADAIHDRLSDKFDALDARREELLDARFGDDDEARQAYLDRIEEEDITPDDGSEVAIYNATNDPSGEESALDVLAKETAVGVRYVQRYDAMASRLLEIDPEALDLPQVEAALSAVSDAQIRVSSVSSWMESHERMAAETNVRADSAIDAIHEQALTPQIERLEKAQADLDDLVSLADDELTVKSSQSPEAMFALRTNKGRMKPGAQQRTQNLQDDLAEIEARFQASGGDERAKLQAKRAALLNAKAEEAGIDDVNAWRDINGRSDPAKAFLYLHESFGESAATDLKNARDVIQSTALEMMAKVVWGLRKGAISGDLRRIINPSVKTTMANMVKEAAGEDTKDATAKVFAKAWLATAEYLRQRFNAAGGDIAKLKSWIMPQFHDPEALMKMGLKKWVAYVLDGDMLDRAAMINPRTERPYTKAELREALTYTWKNITSNGEYGRQVTGYRGAGAMYKRHADHRFIIFKDAESWIKYQREVGGGDLYAVMLGHIDMMARDIAAMERFGANPELVRTRLKQHIIKEASQARSAQSMFDELNAMVEDLKAQYKTIPTRYEQIMTEIGKVHTELDAVRSKSAPQIHGRSKRSKGKIDDLQKRLFSLHEEMRQEMQGGGTPLTPQQIELQGKISALMDEMHDIDIYPVMSRDPAQRASRLLKRADEMWAGYSGASNVPADSIIAGFMQGSRNWLSASMLVFAPMSAVTDQSTQLAARLLTGLPATKQLWSFVKAFTPGDRQLALEVGLGLDQAKAAFELQARYLGRINTRGITGFVADRTHALSFLSPMTQASKTGYGLDAVLSYTGLLKTPYEDLSGNVKDWFTRNGITQADWKALQGVPLQVERGVPMLTRRAIEAVDPDLAEKYMIMIQRGRSKAVLESTMRGRTAIVSDTQKGTAAGEVARSFAMLKSFPISYSMIVIGELYHQIMRGRYYSAAAYGSAIFLCGTLLGALAIQMKNIAQGRDPEDMQDPRFWARSFMQSGGAGIYGDFISSAIGRNGQGLTDTLAGPVWDQFGSVLDLTVGSAVQYAKDEPVNFGRKATNVLRRNTPGAFVPWYARTAYERLIIDELQRQMDPDAHKSFRSKVTNRKRVFGNDYFWAPGSGSPSRGPDFGAAFGQ